MDRDTILRRAAKLAALSQSKASLAEAESAGEALGRLLQEHRLSMADVTAAQMRDAIRCEFVEVDWQRSLPRWVKSMGGAIAIATDTRGIQGVAGNGRTVIKFIGEECDVAVATYWFGVLIHLLPDIAKREVPSLRRTMEAKSRGVNRRMVRDSFLSGAVNRISERLGEMLKPIQHGGTGTSLLVMKQTAIRAWMEEQDIRLKKTRTTSTMVYTSAYDAGQAAANGVTLAHGLHQPGQRTINLGVA
jgi:hypothetical protein